MTLSPGARLGPYEIMSLLGAGGMGEVYRARDTRLDRTVAIKVLPQHYAADPAFRERFDREARVISSLDHPHICALYDVGEHNGAAYLVMQFLEGPTLAERIAGGALPLEEALRYALQIAGALARAHQAGVVHRDLKPRNVMLTQSGAKLVDFGIAKLLGEPAAGGLDAPTLDAGRTAPGVAVGTARYMSPEQARGQAVDARSDLFSFGVLFYESLTGQAPFEGSTHADVLVSILERQAPPLAQHRADLPPELQRIAGKCLEKDPGKRYGSAQDLAADLTRLKGDTTGSRQTAKLSPSIAVLPFVNMSADPENDYFCDGIAEDLITALAKIDQLRVAARTSAFFFKGKSGDLREIGRTLNVGTVLEGSVRKAGNRLRVTAQVVNVADGYQLWSERYDRQIEDVFEIQDQIVLAIVEALKVKLLAGDKDALLKRCTGNIEAYQLCLKARYSWYKWTDDGFRIAIELFEQALKADPDYALAHFGVGDCYLAWSHIGYPGAEARPKIKGRLETALRLDPEMAEAHAVYGIFQGLIEWDWVAAERSVKTASTLNPRSAHVCTGYSVHLVSMGRAGEAIPWARKAVELDPLSPFWNFVLVQAYCGNRNYDAALRQAQSILEFEPRYWMAHCMAGVCLAAQGRAEEAVAAQQRALEFSGGVLYAAGHLGYALALAGRREEAIQKLTELIERSTRQWVPSLSLALVHAGLGQADQAFDALELAWQAHDGWLAMYLSAFPVLDSLRPDPRFADLLRRVGLTP